jgi:tetratricopeptide (TPR) repeat protein
MLEWRIVLEYVAKGLAAGLLASVAGQALLAPQPPAWSETLLAFAAAAVGLAGALGLGAWRMLRQGQRVRGRLLAFVLFLTLEHPGLIYGGVLAGLLVGVAAVTLLYQWPVGYLAAGAAGGLVLGAVSAGIRVLPSRWLRGGTVLLAASAAAAALLYYLRLHPALYGPEREVHFAVRLLLSIPVVYVLTLAGRADETEVEIGVLCVALALALAFLAPPTAMLAGVLAALAVYLVYTLRVMKGVQVIKHTLRGISYASLGQHRQALLAYRRALALDPANRFAREGHWRVHRSLDLDQLVQDPDLLALVDPQLCLERARDLLLQSRPTAEMLDEAQRLLELAGSQRPALRAAVLYWQTVAHTHARRFDAAEQALRHLLDNAAWAADDPYRREVLLPAWLLALVQHSELRRRVGLPLLEQDLRRLDAIRVVEHRLAAVPDDPAGSELKAFLYEGLGEAEFRRLTERHGVPQPGDFDYDHCLRLGQAWLKDPAHWLRGAELLRIAAIGLPQQAASLHLQIALAAERTGDREAARQALTAVKHLVRQQGAEALPEGDRQEYYACLKRQSEEALAEGRLDQAIEDLILYSESGQSGQDTLRLLAELHERKGDALGALYWNERALLFDPANRVNLERKDRYYYSVTPQELQARFEEVGKLFDVGYCLNKARQLLDFKRSGPEQVDWALHLAELARVAAPSSVRACFLAARARLRRGENQQALDLLQEAFAKGNQASFPDAEEEESWYLACRMLGDLYLQQFSRPDQALRFFSLYRKHPKSGVDTIFKMGQCYEALGDRVKASKCYQNVVAYDHPLASDAYSALQRLENR